MLTLYQIAASTNGLVVGTGNKVEDFGVGFYTKYGDGGVDISPIADCMKSDVFAMGKELNILQEIIDHIIPPLEVNKRSQYLSTTSTFLKYRYNYYVTMQSDDCSSHYLNYILGRKSDYYNDRNTSICTKHGVTVGTTSGQIKVSSTHRGIEYACEKTWQEWFALMIIDIALTGDGTDRRAM